MRLLLDTHAFIWAVTEPSRLGTKSRRVIKDADNDVFVSAASMWEIATKYRIGKLVGVDVILDDVASVIHRLQATELPIDHAHALKAGSYPQPHADPFDRMLAAQAELEDLTLVSKDRALRLFGVELLW